MAVLRRPTVSSRASSATTTKSLSALSLTKKSNALESEVEELKTNLEVRSQEGAQRDETLQVLADKVDKLHDAFNSLSDVVACEVEEMHKQIAATASQMEDRVAKLENTVQGLKTQVPESEGKYQKVQETMERRFLHVQEMCTKIELALYESQTELAFVKNAAENLMTREREAVQCQKSLQISQEDAVTALERLKEETSQLEAELFALRKQTSGDTTKVASDVQVLAEVFSALRGSVSKQQSIWVGKLDSLREILDRQGKRDKTLLYQRVDALSDVITSHEIRTKDAMDNLSKNDDRIWCAVKAIQEDRKEKLDQVVQQMAMSSIKCGQRHDELYLSLRSIAQRFEVSLK